MKKSMIRRVRALAAVSTCMLAAMAAGEDSAMERLRAAVDGEAARLRASLDAAEATRDWGEFLERKCTVDGAFAPLHLLLDAMEWQAAAVGNDLVRSMRTEWRDAPVTVQWSHADGDARARQSLGAWVPAPDGRQAVRLEFRTGSEPWVAGDAPPTIQWTAEGCWLDGHPSIHARCAWRLPVAEPVRFDFPLSADGFDLWWDGSGARLQDDRGNAHAERWRGDAIFNNPPELYAAFDALRTVVASDRGTQAGVGEPATRAAGGGNDAAKVGEEINGLGQAGPMLAPGGDPDAQNTLRIRTVRTTDGRLLRAERWHWHGAELRSVVIDQEPVRLRHHAEQAVEIVTELDGRESGRTPHRAESEMVQFPHGARIAISFRAPDPARDRVLRTAPGATVPDRWVLSVDGSMRAWAEFGSVRTGSAELPDTWFAERAVVHRMQGERHRAAAERAARAIELRSPQELQAAQAGIEAALAEAGASPACVAAEWELLAARLLDAGMDSECDAVLAARWLPAAGIAGAPAAIHRRACTGGRALAEHMARVAGVAVPVGIASGADSGVTVGAGASGEDVPGRATPSCDPSILTDGARLVHDAVRNAVVSTVHDADERASLLASLCEGCDAASSQLESAGADRAAAIGADARAALALGQWSAESGNGSAGDRAESDGRPSDGSTAGGTRFGADVARAAGRTPADAGQVASMRSAWDRCADLAVDALRESLRDAGRGTSDDDHATVVEARRALRARRTAVGNAFVPSLDAVDAAAPVDSGALRTRIEPLVSSAVRRELRRAAVMASVLGGPLATARADAAGRRMVEATIAATAGAYMHWAAGSAAPPGTTNPQP